MAVTVQIDEYNGAGTTETTNISNLNYGNNDSTGLTPATYPITAGNNSFTKFIKFDITNFSTSNKVDNLQFYKSAGTYVTGEGIQCSLRTSSYSAPSYATPTITTYTDQTMPVADPGAANWGIATALAGSLTATGKSDYMKSQLQTTGSTPPGNVNQKTFTIEYDEQ